MAPALLSLTERGIAGSSKGQSTGNSANVKSRDAGAQALGGVGIARHEMVRGSYTP